VDDHVRWISGIILKESPDGIGLKWCLEVVISGHTVRWSYFVGQFGSGVKVYSVV
jgi:hypothetical protein